MIQLFHFKAFSIVRLMMVVLMITRCSKIHVGDTGSAIAAHIASSDPIAGLKGNRFTSGVTSNGALGYVPPSTSNSFIFSSLWSKSDSQLSKYCVVCEIGWCRCQQLTALSISTALVTKLLVIEQLLHPALKFAVSAP